MSSYRGVVPKVDLPRVPTTWQTWSVADRIRAARSLPATDWQRKCAVAITLNEQPRKIPVGNCCGLMCWAARAPWGWGGWAGYPPHGYALIREGSGGMIGVFLAFRTPADSLRRLLSAVRSRGISDGETYWREWVCVKSQRTAAIRGFNSKLAEVVAAWPGVVGVDRTIPGWTDAGASR